MPLKETSRVLEPTWKKKQENAHRYYVLRSKKYGFVHSELLKLIRNELDAHEALKEMNRQ